MKTKKSYENWGGRRNGAGRHADGKVSFTVRARPEHVAAICAYADSLDRDPVPLTSTTTPQQAEIVKEFSEKRLKMRL